MVGQGLHRVDATSRKARPHFVGHYQPRLPADLGFYDLRLAEVSAQSRPSWRDATASTGSASTTTGSAESVCWNGRSTHAGRAGRPDFPFCLCWANENWTRRWDGQDQDMLMAQKHSDRGRRSCDPGPDPALRDSRTTFASTASRCSSSIGSTLFPNSARDRRSSGARICREEGIGEIYLAPCGVFELAATDLAGHFGCDAAIEFPPQGIGRSASARRAVAESRLRRRRRRLPGAGRAASDPRTAGLQALHGRHAGLGQHRPPPEQQLLLRTSPLLARSRHWLEAAIARTKRQYSGDERLVFINAWNEWAEGAYLEPDRRFGHSFLEAHANARESSHLLTHGKYSLG